MFAWEQPPSAARRAQPDSFCSIGAHGFVTLVKFLARRL